MSVLEVRGVTKSFDDHTGARKVLDGVDLTVSQGEIVALMGRSGSGKTTLLTIVAGFEQPDEGTVTLAGTQAWNDLAILPQALGLLAELSVEENILLPLRLAGAKGKADELMDRLGIRHLADRYPSECSLGEQQRTALARAAIVQPKLLVADEPVSHQNHAWAEVMMALFVDLAAAGTTCLLATHDEIAVQSASRVIEMSDGRVAGARAHAPDSRA